MLLCFKPFLGTDDYLMSNTLYGVLGDDYDYQVKYENFLYGRLMVFLLRLFPDIPWYTILFYIWIFIALTLLTYVILKWSNAGFNSTAFLAWAKRRGYLDCNDSRNTKRARIVGSVTNCVCIKKDMLESAELPPVDIDDLPI